MLKQVLVVAAGSALGGVARFLLATRVGRWIPGRFPWGTLAVNVIGCFLIAVVLSAVASGVSLSAQTRLFLTTGLMGGFTTYSAFNAELLALGRGGHPALAVAYVVATLLLCVAAGVIGTLAGNGLGHS